VGRQAGTAPALIGITTRPRTFWDQAPNERRRPLERLAAGHTMRRGGREPAAVLSYQVKPSSPGGCCLVAWGGIEPPTPGHEPGEMPFLHPAAKVVAPENGRNYTCCHSGALWLICQ
jgi:hypothetical protein